MNETIYNIKGSKTTVQLEDLFDYLCDEMFEYFSKLPMDEKRRYLVSMSNYTESFYKTTCAKELGPRQSGDIVLCEMGCAYPRELSYAHLGIILSQVNGKAEILPIITGGIGDFERAYHPIYNEEGVSHLIRIYAQPGIDHASVGLVNDVKFLSTARIVRVYGSIAGTSEFKWICKRVDEVRELGRNPRYQEIEQAKRAKANRYKR